MVFNLQQELWLAMKVLAGDMNIPEPRRLALKALLQDG